VSRGERSARASGGGLELTRQAIDTVKILAFFPRS